MARTEPELGRTGWTTGTCAAAAAAAAARVLTGGDAPSEELVELPSGQRAAIPVAWARMDGRDACASVVKNAGDDPDVTDGARVVVRVAKRETGDVEFLAGEGVGTITKRGLQIPPGEPAINPVPREMIRRAVRRLTDAPVAVTVSIPGGEELARKTFNPKLGIEGGLSILGTTGIVRPFSAEALRCSLICALDIATASGHRQLVFVPGNVGRRAALARLAVDAEQVVEASNEWGYMLDALADRPVDALAVMGHPGKLAKLPGGHWNTHSSVSPSAAPYIRSLVKRYGGDPVPEVETAGGLLDAQSIAVRDRVCNVAAAAIRQAVRERTGDRFPVSVMLVDYNAEILGTAGKETPWIRP